MGSRFSPFLAFGLLVWAVVLAPQAFVSNDTSLIAIDALLFAVSSLLVDSWLLERRLLRFAEKVTEILERSSERL